MPESTRTAQTGNIIAAFNMEDVMHSVNHALTLSMSYSSALLPRVEDGLKARAAKDTLYHAVNLALTPDKPHTERSARIVGDCAR